MNPLSTGAHELPVDGATLAYHVHGTGPIVVAIPGGPGFSHRYLRAPRLEERATVVYVDPIGTGRSSRLATPAGYSRARDVADLEALRRHLALERIALLGHSAGGFVAQEYALAHPSRIDRLILCDTTPTNGEAFEASLNEELAARSARPWFPEAAGALRTMFTRILDDDEAIALGRKMVPLYLADPDGNPALVEAFAAGIDIDPIRLQQAPPVPFDHRLALRELDTKALVLVGAHDFICAPRLARALHEALAGSRLVVFERSGHMVHHEEPDRFAAVVAEFLAS